MSASVSRRDNTDRSQARSAWESVPRKSRPVGYGLIVRSYSQRYFSSKWAPCFLRLNTLLETFVSDDVRARDFVTPIRIGAHTCANQTVPYGTALLGWRVPGTSCQATIAPSLRDIWQQALARCCLRNVCQRVP